MKIFTIQIHFIRYVIMDLIYEKAAKTISINNLNSYSKI